VYGGGAAGVRRGYGGGTVGSARGERGGVREGVNELALSEALTRIELNYTEVTRRVNDGLTVHRREISALPMHNYKDGPSARRGGTQTYIHVWTSLYFSFRVEYLSPICLGRSSK
jgi:hypothetical protein